jgi:hypothetical protein
MKKVYFLSLILSTSIFANYSKPQLIARYSGVDSFNAPQGLYCFTAEPLATTEGVFLGCRNQEDHSLMIRFSPKYELLATHETSLFSTPKEVLGKTSWFEFSQAGVQKLFDFQKGLLSQRELKNLGSLYSQIDSFTPIKNEFYIYRCQDETKQILMWQNHISTPLFKEVTSHIFPPVTSIQGDFIFKIRKGDTQESSPDELILWNGKFKKILSDKDADPSSPFKSFRHQMALDNETLAFIGTDDQGEALFLLRDGKFEEVARVGKDLLSFDYFSPKLRNETLVFRGTDLNRRKVLWIYKQGILERLLTQGDVVHTDKGFARVDYKSQDALFYGAPGISESGDVYQQATLTDIDSTITLLGIGLLQFKKE